MPQDDRRCNKKTRIHCDERRSKCHQCRGCRPRNERHGNPFQGWWLRRTRGSDSVSIFTRNVDFGIDMETRLMFIDTTKTPIEVTSYTGVPPQLCDHGELVSGAREPSTLEAPNPAITLYDQVSETVLVRSDNNAPPFIGRESLTLQDNGKTLVGFGDANGTRGNGSVKDSIFKKIKCPPPIRPFGPGEELFPDPNDPVFMFKEHYEYIITNDAITNPRLKEQERFPGLKKVEKHKNLLLTTGVLYRPVQVTQVQITTNVQPVLGRPPNVPLTTLIFECDPFPIVGGRAFLTGFTGSLASLNGTHTIQWAEQTAYDKNPNFVNAALTFRFTIPVNTAGLAAEADFFGYITTGLGTAQVFIPPVTSTSEYQTMMTAIIDMHRYAIRLSTHSAFFTYFPRIISPAPPSNQEMIPTFGELQTRLLNGTSLTHVYVQRRYPPPASIWYLFLFTALVAGANSPPGQPVPYVPVNDRFFGQIPISTAGWIYNVPASNYLEQAYNLYWTMEGPATTPVQSFASITYGFGGAIGQTFKGVVSPLGVAPVGRFFLMGAPIPGFNVAFSQFFLFGRIKPSWVNGQNIGYVRIFDYRLTDPNLYMTQSDFVPPEAAGTPRPTIEAYCRVLSEAFRFLKNDLGCTDILFDIRGSLNERYATPAVLSSFFGGDRCFGNRFNNVSEIGGGPLTNLANYEYHNDAYTKDVEVFNQVLPSLNKQFYGDVVFDNCKVRCLVDNQAQCCGDLFIHGFLGNNLDKRLGNNTRAKIFGDLDGRLDGFFGNTNPQTVNAEGFIIQAPPPNPPNTPFPFIQLSLENPGNGQFKMIKEPVFLCNRCLYLKPDAGPNLGPGPWLNTFEDVLYGDIGVIPSTEPRLPGDPRPPPTFPLSGNPALRANWRDKWLEEVVHEIIGV